MTIITTQTASEAVTESVSAWDGVTVRDHPRGGGVEFRFGRRELGHLHARIADLPLPRRVRDEVIEEGRARPHHVMPDSGWITVPMETDAEIDNVVGLFRMSYERALEAERRRTAR